MPWAPIIKSWFPGESCRRRWRVRLCFRELLNSSVPRTISLYIYANVTAVITGRNSARSRSPSSRRTASAATGQGRHSAHGQIEKAQPFGKQSQQQDKRRRRSIGRDRRYHLGRQHSRVILRAMMWGKGDQQGFGQQRVSGTLVILQHPLEGRALLF